MPLSSIELQLRHRGKQSDVAVPRSPAADATVKTKVSSAKLKANERQIGQLKKEFKRPEARLVSRKRALDDGSAVTRDAS